MAGALSGSPAPCLSTESGDFTQRLGQARVRGWTLVATPYVIAEVLNNLADFLSSATAGWASLRTDLQVLDDVLTVDRPAIFAPGKDRPVLFSALAWADVLLTRDTGDFGAMLGGAFYEGLVLTPGDSLQRERRAGRL